MTATLSGTKLAANGPRRYAVQAADSATVSSNAARLPVIQAVSLVTSCSNPAPQAVAINSGLNAAIVTNPAATKLPWSAWRTAPDLPTAPVLAPVRNLPCNRIRKVSTSIPRPGWRSSPMREAAACPSSIWLTTACPLVSPRIRSRRRGHRSRHWQCSGHRQWRQCGG